MTQLSRSRQMPKTRQLVLPDKGLLPLAWPIHLGRIKGYDTPQRKFDARRDLTFSNVRSPEINDFSRKIQCFSRAAEAVVQFRVAARYPKR